MKTVDGEEEEDEEEDEEENTEEGLDEQVNCCLQMKCVVMESSD